MMSSRMPLKATISDWPFHYSRKDPSIFIMHVCSECCREMRKQWRICCGGGKCKFMDRSELKDGQPNSINVFFLSPHYIYIYIYWHLYLFIWWRPIMTQLWQNNLPQCKHPALSFYFFRLSFSLAYVILLAVFFCFFIWK